MSKPVMKGYPAEFKERAVKLAVESEQPIAQTARDLGVNENTLHTWIGKYHRVERQEKEVHNEHLYPGLFTKPKNRPKRAHLMSGYLSAQPHHRRIMSLNQAHKAVPSTVPIGLLVAIRNNAS
jgi:transposase